jgi:hypothetical protein
MMRYALEREPYRGSTPAVSVGLPKERMPVPDLCREYEVSRPRADKRIKHQYDEVGPEGSQGTRVEEL